MKLIITAAVVLVIAVVTQAKGGKSLRGGKNRSGASSEELGGLSGHSNRHQEGTRYSWTRLIGSESPAREDAFVPTNYSTVLVRSQDRTLRALNYSKALTLYDYASDSNVVVILVENTCYLRDTALTYQQVIDTLNSRNGTNVTDAAKSYLNGTQPALSKVEAQAIYLKYPQVQRLCHEGRLVQALDAEGKPSND
ncbi:unnamed protein product [Lymnaea stagnalis]|uniref:Uncharacterized protein n=1 Tax=Lymnaea stagnalis TaxID=6523 RepID=A0AAV2IHL3_LYMST